MPSSYYAGYGASPGMKLEYHRKSDDSTFHFQEKQYFLGFSTCVFLVGPLALYLHCVLLALRVMWAYCVFIWSQTANPPHPSPLNFSPPYPPPPTH